MPTSKEPPKQPSKPRKSTRTSKSVATTSETEIPIPSAKNGSRRRIADVKTDDDHLSTGVAAPGDGLAHGEDMDSRIRQRAYEIYQARGYSSGNELEDWLEAERQVRSSPSSFVRTDGRASDDATA